MLNRRQLLKRGAAAGSASLLAALGPFDMPILSAADSRREFPPPGDRPPPRPPGVSVLNPRGRVPVSLIIDDSTCLVNLAHFCIPHFAEVYPERYQQDWRKLPREIPDVFVRKFGEWCRERGIRGKYSVVPYPACVGWVDRDMPGWSRRELRESLKLVRELLMPDWDIHPEMITHTFAIDTRTGRPYPDRTDAFLENSGFSVQKSPAELADYLAYALRILKNAGLHCDGITTPGGFGNRNRDALALATKDAVTDIFAAPIPHYFRHLFTDERSVAPMVEYASGLDTDDPRCVVSIIGCTSDWFGGWDGLERGSTDLFITPDLQAGRLPEVISRGEPAVLVCHWPGMYFNGEEFGFQIFQEVVRRLNARYDHLQWMKLSEIARYWAAKELTTIEQTDRGFAIRAPYACPQFTLRLPRRGKGPPQFKKETEPQDLREVTRHLDLASGSWRGEADFVDLCVDLPRGRSEIAM